MWPTGLNDWESVTVVVDKKFTPLDAYFVSMNKDGLLFRDDELSNPDVVPVIVVNFSYMHTNYEAIYHDQLDKWEVFSSRGKEWAVADKNSDLYKLANQTADKFKHKLLDGPCHAAMSKLMAEEMMMSIVEEIDKSGGFSAFDDDKKLAALGKTMSMSLDGFLEAADKMDSPARRVMIIQSRLLSKQG